MIVIEYQLQLTNANRSHVEKVKKLHTKLLTKFEENEFNIRNDKNDEIKVTFYSKYGDSEYKVVPCHETDCDGMLLREANKMYGLGNGFLLVNMTALNPIQRIRV